MSNEKIPLGQMLEGFLLAEAEIDVPPMPVREPGEPSLQEYEDHVKGIRMLPLAVLREVNQNPRWQRTLAIFRESFGFNVTPVAAALAKISEWIDSSFHLLLPLAQIHADNRHEGSHPEYSAVIEDGEGQISAGVIGMRQGPFLSSDDHLVMRIYLKQPAFADDLQPFQLLLVALPDHQPLATLDLLEKEQLIKIKLPHEFAQRYRDLLQSSGPPASPARLPFGFVIRVGHGRNPAIH